jgi:hypothetical protein
MMGGAGNNSIVLYQDENGVTKVSVRFSEEDIWLTEMQIAEIYDTSRQNINQHVANIYREGELAEISTCKKFLRVQTEGKRQVERGIDHYNLDMVIAIGYRVQSQIATRFRQWATQRLHEYIQKGFALDDERLKQGGGRYFRELLQRIRDIRSSERNFYQQVTDIYATAIDYDPRSDKAVSELQNAAGNLQGLYEANQGVYSLLKYGAKVKENPSEPEKTVYFIDWDYSQNNEFAIAEEMTIKDKCERRPDLVVYINGISVAVIELKKSTVAVSHGIQQNLSNQSKHFNKPFFSTIQFVMAGNNAEGLRYGTIETKEKYYLEWKNDTIDTKAQSLDDVSIDINKKCASFPNKLDWQLYSMFQKRHLLDLIHNFVVFDKGQKKVCRHNQYFGVKKARFEQILDERCKYSLDQPNCQALTSSRFLSRLNTD